MKDGEVEKYRCRLGDIRVEESSEKEDFFFFFNWKVARPNDKLVVRARVI